MKKIKIIDLDETIRYGKIISISQAPIPDPDSERTFWVPYTITFFDTDGTLKQGTVEASKIDNQFVIDYRTQPEKPKEDYKTEEEVIPIDEIPEINID